MDIQDLREITRLSRAAQEERARQHQLELADQARQRQQQEDLKTQHVIDQIEGRAKAEAHVGRDHAIVMSLDYSDYARPRDFKGGYNLCYPEWLKGVGARVFVYCTSAGLAPTLEFWHDGVGNKSGFNIVVHW